MPNHRDDVLRMSADTYSNMLRAAPSTMFDQLTGFFSSFCTTGAVAEEAIVESGVSSKKND